MNAENPSFPRWPTQDSKFLEGAFVIITSLLVAVLVTLMCLLVASTTRDKSAALPLLATHETVDDPQPSNSPKNESFALASGSRGESKIPFLAGSGRSHIKLDFIPVDERTSRSRRGFPRVTAPEGAYGIEGHGTPDSVFCRTGEPMSARELAKWILNDSRYHTGMPVVLLCCETGKGNRPFAQKLADALGGDVVAPTEKVWPLKTGLYLVAQEKTTKSLGMFDVGAQRADITRLGEMKTFRPAQGVDSTTDTLLAARSSATSPSGTYASIAPIRTPKSTLKTKTRAGAKTASLLAGVQGSADRTLYLNQSKKTTPANGTKKATVTAQSDTQLR